MTDPVANPWQSPIAYDRGRFIAKFTEVFAKDARLNAGSVPAMLTLLGHIERVRKIVDIRWAAYLLATTMWETTSPQRVERPVLNKKGQSLRDKKGKPITVKHIRWIMTMAPVEEIGHSKGHRYHQPVKVKLLADGRVRITEHDGDQFIVKADGKFKAISKGAKPGAADAAPAAKVYDDDDGDEQVYFGRGYVQLTWWSNYARAGALMGRGYALLLDPDKVKTPEIAYALMSYGMRTGEGFANGNCFTDYFTDTSTDYVAARAMVNGDNHAEDIAKIAKKFQAVLLQSQGVGAAAALPGQRLP